MNANEIIKDDMTLEEKLKAIDEAMKEQTEKENQIRVVAGLPPVDPASLTICDGCE